MQTGLKKPIFLATTVHPQHPVVPTEQSSALSLQGMCQSEHGLRAVASSLQEGWDDMHKSGVYFFVFENTAVTDESGRELSTAAGMQCSSSALAVGNRQCTVSSEYQLLGVEALLDGSHSDYRTETAKDCKEICKSKPSCKAFRFVPSNSSKSAPKQCTLYRKGVLSQSTTTSRQEVVGTCEGSGRTQPTVKLCDIKAGAEIDSRGISLVNDVKHTSSSPQKCAALCQQVGSCKTFEFSPDNLECTLYQGGRVTLTTKGSSYAGVCLR
jgi:hypothetical protein